MTTIALAPSPLVDECPICSHDEHCDPIGRESEPCSVRDCLCQVCPSCGGHEDINGGRPCLRCGGEGVAA